MPQHAPTCSNTLQSIVLRNVYYRMDRVGANRSMLGHYDANKPHISVAESVKIGVWVMTIPTANISSRDL